MVLNLDIPNTLRYFSKLLENQMHFLEMYYTVNRHIYVALNDLESFFFTLCDLAFFSMTRADQALQEYAKSTT